MAKKERIIEPLEASMDEVTERLLKSNAESQIQLELDIPLIKHEEYGEKIYQRLKDGYVNATSMCKAAHKLFGDYYRLRQTTEYLNELSTVMGIPITELIQVVKGGKPGVQGTWVHPQVAIHLAQWLSAKFAVQVTKWVFDWLSGNISDPSLPYHLRRYVANLNAIPHTHFSILQMLTMDLIAPMELKGYVLPENMVPDISEGRMFCKWLRVEKGVNTDTLPMYDHRYEDGRVVRAKLYPNALLHDFKKHFHDVWMKKQSVKYFKERDKKAIPYLYQVLQLPYKEEDKS